MATLLAAFRLDARSDRRTDPGRRDEPLHRTSPGLGARRHPRGRVPALPRPRDLAAGPRGGARPQARLPDRAVNGITLGRALFPRGERVHADLRADAQRQSRARLALPARRLSRLRVRRSHRRLAPQPRRRLRHHRARSASCCSSSSSAGWRGRTCARPWSPSASPSSSPTSCSGSGAAISTRSRPTG